ncbi:hypothetical protein [Acidithiobacillus sp.]|jgi:hypothetical protein|uniref:hypothetical protein n=1 Tax=Acidithiobacillus sp. TaxID=1872118 RepID=UPI0025BA6DFE|nr:hypothetical protein [Acidithiobacillus sp.]MCK9189621.1 hypothetical protein [Acidithiobacillus sp.]MCK9359816.1 hypothetical protein [Acidithiobacillus sp.]
MAITLETRMTYWRSLLPYIPNMLLVPCYTDELRTALRDALCAIEDLCGQMERDRQSYAQVKANSRPLSPVRWRITDADVALVLRAKQKTRHGEFR